MSPVAVARTLAEFERDARVERARGREVVTCTGADAFEVTLRLVDGHVARIIDAEVTAALASAHRFLRWHR